MQTIVYNFNETTAAYLFYVLTFLSTLKVKNVSRFHVCLKKN